MNNSDTPIKPREIYLFKGNIISQKEYYQYLSDQNANGHNIIPAVETILIYGIYEDGMQQGDLLKTLIKISK